MKKKCPAVMLSDFYKWSHPDQYPEGTQFIFATFTPRNSLLEGINSVKAFGFQGFVKKYLIDYFNENFFDLPKEEVIADYKRVVKFCLFVENPDTSKIEALHDLGYLPVLIKAVEEGETVPIKVPVLTIENTFPEFFWVPNFLETLISCEIWLPITSATVANEYRKILEHYAMETVGNIDFVPFQAHDFSFRGMSSVESAEKSGAAHLLSFVGTDTIPAIHYLEQYYNANIETELVGCSVPATEHAVMCAGGADNEFDTYERLITEVYPSGIVSIVSDTWDLWHVLTDTIPKLKDKILSRDGKVVIRPDSGDPVKILCGYTFKEIPYLDEEFIFDMADEFEVVKCDGKYYTFDSYDTGWTTKVDFAEISEAEVKGVVELLWDTFGGTYSEKGFKLLDSHIGAIYGDSITLERCKAICEGLKRKGFVSINHVEGVGSYTYQFKTRDSLGQAMKSTHAKINGVEKNIFKNPITDTANIKKSQTGRVIVEIDEQGNKFLTDGLTIEMEKLREKTNILKPLFKDSVLLRETTLAEMREKTRKD